MRKQYSFRPAGEGLDAWDVDRLIEAASHLRVKDVAVESIAQGDTDYWFCFGPSPSVRRIVDQVRLIQEVDCSFPVILGADGR